MPSSAVQAHRRFKTKRLDGAPDEVKQNFAELAHRRFKTKRLDDAPDNVRHKFAENTAGRDKKGRFARKEAAPDGMDDAHSAHGPIKRERHTPGCLLCDSS